MSDIKFRARIKDVESSVKSSHKKPLDDIFGFEIITPNEADKELLALLLDIISHKELCSRINVHDKSNGYAAFHRVCAVKNEISYEDFINLREYIKQAKVRKLKLQYRDYNRTKQQEVPKSELYDIVEMYPELNKLISSNELSDSTLEAIKKSALTIYHCLRTTNIRSIPAIEFQFKTAEVAQEATYGTASHFDYKPVDRKKIIENYKNNRLIRGIHFPFKFKRFGNGMILQEAYKTLFEMYPFLKDTLLEYRKFSQENIERKNMVFGRVFPSLLPYIKENRSSEIPNNADPDLNWQLLMKQFDEFNNEGQEL